MKIVLLGVIGPWQMLITLAVLGIPVLIIVLIIKNSKNKAKADTLDSIVREKSKNSTDSLDKIERLHKMQMDGVLTKEEFELEKKKLLG